jgi:hypothetical protein
MQACGSGFTMRDVMKIGGVTCWLKAMPDGALARIPRYGCRNLARAETHRRW